MPDIREVFPSLEDGSGVGAALSKAEAGDAAAGKVGSVGFGFRDSSGNLVLPQLTADGKIPVDTELSSGNELYNTGSDGTGSLTPIDLATITLVASKLTRQIKAVLSSTRTSYAEVVWNNNGVETVLGYMILGAGQFSFTWDMPKVSFTSGGTGTQELILRAKNLDKVSALYGTIECIQAA